ncbi:MAG: S8 family peptidase [Chitinophagales bacterium]|nr:S8 family peptidase [Chitinophagales bacterium]
MKNAFVRVIIVAYLFCFWQGVGYAQIQQVYWVQFNSKSSNLFLPATSFLSAKAIERRTKQGIAISENDYPVYEPYKQAVAQVADSVIHTLKWFNAVTIVLSDSSKLPQIRNMNFVAKIQKLDVTPVAEKKESDKLALQFKEAADNADVGNTYGKSFSQVQMLHLNRLHEAGFQGQNILIAVFDNGFQNVDTISAFRHLFNENRVVYTANYVKRNTDIFTEGSHGTSVLSCIAAKNKGVYVGTATEANFALFKTEDNQSETILEEFHWAEAAEKADSLGADILSTSLGYNTFNDGFANHTYFDLTGDKSVITQAANTAFSKGVLVVNSAGNEGEKSWRFITVPADGKDVLAVGAVNASGVIGAFSSRGPSASGAIKPDVCAQGANVMVLDVVGRPSVSGGTSFACPIIAGAAACLWQADSTLSAAELKTLIVESAHLYSSPNNDYGYGIPNFYKAFLNTTAKKELLHTDKRIVAFPNPFNNAISVFVKTEVAGEAKVSIADLSGKVVFKASLSVFANDVQLLPIEESSTWSAGAYLLVLDFSGKRTIHKIVKMDQ